MDITRFRVEDPDGLTSVVHEWVPARVPRGVIHVLHGWGEHALRYERLAGRLTAAGFAVYADDHRGHGQSGLINGSLGDLGPRGMEGVLDAVKSVSDAVRARHTGVPFFLLGHSWGSFLAQQYVRRWAEGLAGLLLTGTTLRRPDAAPRSGGLNAAFEPARTPYDWLSRDEAEVDKYIDDPLCGFEVMRPAARADRVATADDHHHGDEAIPLTLPIFVLNGADDPIGGSVGGQALAAHYRALGIADVTFRAYAGGRHELFNELNRDEVEGDVVEWLEAHLV